MPTIVPPTAEEWEKHRRLITDLYTRRTLKFIRAHLKDVHGFNATPVSFPPTPATTAGYRSPTVYEPEDITVNPDVLRIDIVNNAVSILSRLVEGRPVGAGFEDCTPTDDHIGIYRTLQEDLKHESYIRGCLVNNPSAAATASLDEHVKDLLKAYHPAMPIGLLSTVNQCMDYNAIHKLAHSLVDSSADVLPQNDDFIHLAHRLRRLLSITTIEKFQHFMERICESLESKVLKVLGRKSLVTIYLMFLLSAKKAKRERKPDNKILGMALESMAHVQHSYQDDPKLIVQFSLFITGYCTLAAPEGKFDQGVLGMAEDCCARAEKYLIQLESTDGSKAADIRDAKSHYGKSCSLLADCRYAQGNELYQEDREELHRSSRRLLLLAIAYHVDCSLGTMAQFERQKQKLERWCHDANDAWRLQQLKDFEKLINDYKQRPKDGPLVPRLSVLRLIEDTTENASLW
ncbi:hypothetical protein LZ31DRAFT_570697 [Colletotrichum somersetense]|nr:hypothetical protein LZ31DRAFT_570697 [Colletotrichum somersetense]